MDRLHNDMEVTFSFSHSQRNILLGGDLNTVHITELDFILEPFEYIYIYIHTDYYY